MKKNRLAVIIVLLIISFFVNFVPAFAEGGEQSTSPGTPGQKPLNLISVTLEDGSRIDIADGITISPKFKLTFDKNVVNMLYWENNSKCFSIVSVSGEGIPVSVTKIDDTVDFSQRQNIFVQPLTKLKPGTSYVIKISPELTAKNGIKLGGSTSGKEISVSFKTQGQVPSTNTSAAGGSTANQSGQALPTKKPGTSTVSAAAVSSKASNSIVDNKNDKAASVSSANIRTGQESETGMDKAAADTKTAVDSLGNTGNKQLGSHPNPLYNWGSIGLVLIIICWIAVETIVRRRRAIAKKN